MPKISSRVILLPAVLAMFALYMLRTAHVDAAGAECKPRKSRQLPVPLIPQETDNWCWAASAQMVKTFVFLKVHPNGDVAQFSQCAEASKANGGTSCCTTSMPDGCDRSRWPSFGAPDFIATDTWGPSPPPPPPPPLPLPPLSWKTIKEEVGCKGRPFVFAWRAVGGGGHMVVVVGYDGKDGEQSVLINDPDGSFYGKSWDWYAGQAENANTHWRDFYAIEYIP